MMADGLSCCQNMMATIYAHAYGLPLVMSRSFNHIGPGQTPQFVVADFCSQAVKIEKQGDINNFRQ